MATYVIGDVQGCFLSFQKLLGEIQFNPRNDNLILLGDTINRGPNSLEMLRFVKAHESSIDLVLGNHEIFAIALALDVHKNSKPHTLHELMSARDRDELITWLRSRPLIKRSGHNIFVHAGILPAVSVADAMRHAQAISAILRGDKAKKFLQRFYEKTPTTYSETLGEKKLLRLTLAYLTLLRACESATVMDLNYTGTLEKIPRKLKPWFFLRDDRDVNIFFGHWAALGIFQYNGYYCLDSGCSWGNQLSAMRLSDRMLFQVENSELISIKRGA